MLVLSRKLHEKVIATIDGVDIEIVVVDIDRGKVRLGFRGPQSVVFMREELLRNPHSAGPKPPETK